ncbi:hypothetical protein AMTR_s00027p00219680 [Amborella trichopoda]|uniref:Aminotransferase-like plant mobile domain-containing protein n=1 Tax=Amborella trichopoda TaxID=13333 RepID=W1PSV8_AMBTC|nr:hypothetical protein AMTR_s00027p00219680 [Amborella trichopoda]
MVEANFRELPPNATNVEVVRYTRAYLLFLTIVIIFADALVATCQQGTYNPLKILRKLADMHECWYYEHIIHMRPTPHSIYPNMPKAKIWEPPKNYYGNRYNLMPPIRQEFDNLHPNEVIWNPYFKPDKVISVDKHTTFQIAMCITTHIFDDIAEPYMSDRVCRQFGAKQGIPRNPSSVGRRSSKQGGQRDCRNVNSDKIYHWLSRHEHMMTDIESDTTNGLPSDEYKVWYNRVSHPIIHNVANPPIDILQPHNQEEEEVVPAHEPQYIMRHRGYEDQLFVPVDMEDIGARMEILQREVNDEVVQEEAGQDVVGESNRTAAEVLAPSTQPAVEEPRRHNMRKKQYQLNKRRPM